MNISKIKLVREAKGYTKKYLCDEIGMTTNGYDHAIKHMTLKVRDLEKIADVLEVPVTLFFDVPNSAVQNFLNQGDNSSSNIASILNQSGIFGNENKVNSESENELLIEKNKSLKKEIEGLKIQLELKNEIIGILKAK